MLAVKSSAFVAVLEFCAVGTSLMGTAIAFGLPPTLFLFAAWCLVFAYVLTVRTKRQSVR